jgi:hypothetical protein
MLDLRLFQRVLDIINYSIDNGLTINQAIQHYGLTQEWWIDMQAKIEAAYSKGRISDNEWNRYNKSLSECSYQEFSLNQYDTSQIESIVNEITLLSSNIKNDPEKRISYKIGQLLVILKNILPDGSYIRFVESNLPFSQRTARRYTHIYFELGGEYNPEYFESSLVQGSFNSDDAIDEPIFNLLPNAKTINDLDDDYDNRSKWSVDRDDNGEIIRYNYNILVRDMPPFRGSLSPSQMEEIYRKYPYVTQNTISQDFPYLTFAELKKILRCFNITKDKLFPLHIIESHTEEQLAEFALKAKESAGMKKMVEKKSEYFEKRLKDTQKDLQNIQDQQNWIENLLNKYYDENRPRTTQTLKFSSIDNSESQSKEKHTRLYCFMSDLHIGKFYDNPIYGRGFSKEIAKERFEQIAFHICREANKYEHLTILCGGDLVESIQEDGLHHGIHRYMDLFQDDQIFYTIDLFYMLFSTILENTNFKSIELLGLEGNHDRIGSQRHDDKNRTSAKIVYRILEREWKNKIKVILAKEGIINQTREDICIISHHGDANLGKKKGEELVNLFGDGKKYYHLVLKGHFHHLECKEGTNFLSMTLPSVCSADTYSIAEFAQNSQPGIILGHQAEFGLGFDFKKITLF